MKHLLVILLTLCLAGSVFAFNPDLTNQAQPKNTIPGSNPGTPDGREGGETIATAVVIPGLPYVDTGNTCDNIDDYDEACPFIGSTSPDVVYELNATVTGNFNVDLCDSGYDTKVYVYKNAYTPGAPYACNDDGCPGFRSIIEEMLIEAGNTYWFVVDGYGGDCGDYIIEIAPPPGPCDLICPDNGTPEGEPPLVTNYVDNYNGGCNSDFPYPFTLLEGNQADNPTCITICGVSGWYCYGVSNYRDTDWYECYAADGVFNITLEGDGETDIGTYFFELGPTSCASVGVIQNILAGPCDPQVMNIPTTPGDLNWLWAGPGGWLPECPDPAVEYDYLMTVCGIVPTIATQTNSWGTVKDMYR